MLHGNLRFVNGQTVHPHQDFKRIAEIESRQHPMAAVLSCADSRAPPEIIFDMGFGDIFTCRVAGNLATPEELASLEYSVLECGVKAIFVMGHTSCGAVKAALSGKVRASFERPYCSTPPPLLLSTSTQGLPRVHRLSRGQLGCCRDASSKSASR